MIRGSGGELDTMDDCLHLHQASRVDPGAWWMGRKYMLSLAFMQKIFIGANFVIDHWQALRRNF